MCYIVRSEGNLHWLRGIPYFLQLILGGFFYIRSPALFEDIPKDEATWHAQNFSLEYVKEKYEQNAINCFIAAGIYVAIFIFSFIQQRMNAQGNYEMS